jgi:hypothetical protein
MQVEDVEGIEVTLQKDVTLHSREHPEQTVQIQSNGLVDENDGNEVKDLLLNAHKAYDGTTTTTTWHKPQDSASASGVKTNGAGDLTTFITALLTNVIMMGMCYGFFILMQGKYPMMYRNNIDTNLNAPGLTTLENGTAGFVKIALEATRDKPDIHQPGKEEEHWPLMETVGLDHAMLVQFMTLSMKIMATIGLPMFFIMGPINCTFGGHAAGDDHLSYLSFGNVVNGSQLYWIHACIVWAVVYIVTNSLLDAQTKFKDYRYRWLRTLPEPRANTLLVENIPEDYRSDRELANLFTKMFAPVASTYIVKADKSQDGIEQLYAERERKIQEMKKADYKEKEGQASAEEKQENSIRKKDIAVLAEQITALQKKVEENPSAYATASGFVTFKDTSSVDMALMVQIGDNDDEWELSRPPEAKDIIWEDLQHVDNSKKTTWALIGYALTAGLYMAYLPAVVGITQIAVTINMGPLQPGWAAFAPTMGLQFMVAFLPTFLILIFRCCFTLKDDAFAQQMLQNWYFIFQLVFVILVTAIGSSMVEFLETLVESPTQVFPLLGSTMPFATHFYMNYLVLQWASHAMVLTRYIPLTKFLIFKRMYDDDTARSLAEPEDQDYYGIGSRSCRLSTNLCIGIIYGTLSPPINILTWVEFAVCKYTYGYLFTCAESRKADLGGYFWVQQLRHVFTGTMLYVIVMTGVFLGRATTNGPGIIAAPALFYVILQARKLEKIPWEQLPYQELKMGGKAKVQRKKPSGEYKQEWLMKLKPI